MHRRDLDDSVFQLALMANNPVHNVIKRVHSAAAVDHIDGAKRGRYHSSDETYYDQKRANAGEENDTDMEVVSSEKLGYVENTGDMEMDVDSNSQQQHPHEQLQRPQQQKEEEQQEQEQQQQPQPQQEPQQQQHEEEETGQHQHQGTVRRRASFSAQIYQGRNNNGFHTKLDLNGHYFVGQKFDANNPTKIDAAFLPQTLDDVEYMYQATHGGDFMRHLMNSNPDEDL